jgi:hypothetical protein
MMRQHSYFRPEPDGDRSASCCPASALVLIVTVFTGLAQDILPSKISPHPGLSESQVLGPGDQLLVRALHVPEISDKPVRIDESGFLRLALVGDIQAKALRRRESTRFRDANA